jgi:hypothetical protein
METLRLRSRLSEMGATSSDKMKHSSTARREPSPRIAPSAEKNTASPEQSDNVPSISRSANHFRWSARTSAVERDLPDQDRAATLTPAREAMLPTISSVITMALG